MESPLAGHYDTDMLSLLCAALVSSAPVVEASVETTPKRQLSFTGALVGAWGLSPGDPFTLNVGAVATTMSQEPSRTSARLSSQNRMS